jgi:hypothetical protein
MRVKRIKLTSELAALLSHRSGKQPNAESSLNSVANRKRARQLDRLKKHRVVTVADLLERLPRLSPGLKYFGVELIQLLEIQQAVPVLLDLMSDRAVRLMCASTLSFMKSGQRKATRFFLEIGRRELASRTPDRDWLEAVCHGLAHSDDRHAVELLVTIFERTDLPGQLRGEAADKLGCCAFVCDRRTELFRRCRDAAIRGLEEDSIYVQFGSMYLIGSLCSRGYRPQRPQPTGCESALPKLRKIAAGDHRLAPGFWWRMSAEAEDVIYCIKKGHWPKRDAADRSTATTERGE